jgi:hypothetical protein
MTVVDKLLTPGEYYLDSLKKDSIFIHHTAGGHRADWTIDGWDKDRTSSGTRLAVATAYVIGGLSITPTKNLLGIKSYDSSFDGVIYRAFDDQYWAHHLGCKTSNNKQLNQKSIGIEICNYGPVTKTKEGIFLNYVNKAIPAEMVAELPKPFKGFTHYHKYTEKQLISLKALLQTLSVKYNINLGRGMKQMLNAGSDAFAISVLALSGGDGLWTHVNVREDKFDCWPQPQLIDLIKTL